MRYTPAACIAWACLAACDYAPLPRLDLGGSNDDAGVDGDAPPGVVSLTASPAAFILHQGDTRETTLTLSNGTREAIAVPSEFAVTGLVGGTLTFAGHTCGAELAAGASCGATGTLAASATVQTTFDVSLGAATTRLSMTAMPACPANCGSFGLANCCVSSVVPGNAAGSARGPSPAARPRSGAATRTMASRTVMSPRFALATSRRAATAGGGTPTWQATAPSGRSTGTGPAIPASAGTARTWFPIPTV